MGINHLAPYPIAPNYQLGGLARGAPSNYHLTSRQKTIWKPSWGVKLGGTQLNTDCPPCYGPGGIRTPSLPRARRALYRWATGPNLRQKIGQSSKIREGFKRVGWRATAPFCPLQPSPPNSREGRGGRRRRWRWQRGLGWRRGWEGGWWRADGGWAPEGRWN